MPAVSRLTSSGVKPTFLGLIVVSSGMVSNRATMGASTSGGSASTWLYSSLNVCLALFNSSIELLGADCNSSISELRGSSVL